MNPLRPLEIVGGGLAGLSLGLALRREGVPVVIYESGDYPRHRVCGEFISGLAAGTIKRLGLAPHLRGACRHRTVAWQIQGEPGPRQKLPADALGISRHLLDARLAAAFREAGGDLRTRTRLDPRAAPAGRIFAHGRNPGRSPWIGLKFHALALPLAAHLEVHLGDEAYVGLSGVEDGRVNVCGFFHRRKVRGLGAELFHGYLRAAGLPELAGRLAAAPFDPASFSAVAGLVVDRAANRQTGFRIGDACAMIAPFTGDGMAMAFQGAEAALDPLLAYARGACDWPAATAAAHLALRRRFRRRLGSASALHPFLLRPRRQRWLAAASRTGLLPLGPLYSLLH
jgi:2-polyprenyl-6-methoxyphenol hydroxylase-like FAD-dependent oxidoreductase